MTVERLSSGTYGNDGVGEGVWLWKGGREGRGEKRERLRKEDRKEEGVIARGPDW